MIVSFDELRRAAFRALDVGGAAPGIDDEVGWASAWLEARDYRVIEMRVADVERDLAAELVRLEGMLR